MAFSPTTISALWNPPLWMRAIDEGLATFPSIFNSGVIFNSPQATEIASGPGTSASMNFFKDVTDSDDEIQAESADIDVDALTSGSMVVPILNRQKGTGATALAAAVSGTNPMAQIGSFLATRRAKQRQKTLLAILRGIFGSALANGASAPMSSVRLDRFDESGNNATAAQLFDVDAFIDGKSLLGELQDGLRNGALYIHSTVLAGLEKSDNTAFKEVSKGPFTVRTYREVPIIISDSLVRAGTSDGFVFETYLITNGVIGYGSKPQVGDAIDVASLQLDVFKRKNEAAIYDRTRFVMHPNGMKWKGTPSGQSATNTELQTVGNWELALSTANRVGAVCIRTNG